MHGPLAAPPRRTSAAPNASDATPLIHNIVAIALGELEVVLDVVFRTHASGGGADDARIAAARRRISAFVAVEGMVGGNERASVLLGMVHTTVAIAKKIVPRTTYATTSTTAERGIIVRPGRRRRRRHRRLRYREIVAHRVVVVLAARGVPDIVRRHRLAQSMPVSSFGCVGPTRPHVAVVVVSSPSSQN